MGREHGTEESASGVASTIQPQRFYLVGAPSIGKAKIANELAERFDERLAIFDEHFNTPWALGTVADYRIELHLALSRFMRDCDMPTLHSHSLIDNLAYITYALSRYKLGTVALGTVERAILTMTILGTILRDSFKYDHVFFMRADFDPNEDCDQYQLQTILQMILDDYQINYSIIDVDEDAIDKISGVLEGYLSE